MTRPLHDVLAVLEMVDEGLSDAAISERTSVPAATVRTWRRGRVPRRARLERAGIATCEACGEIAHDPAGLHAPTYAYLLGQYLGDGCLSVANRTHSLRIATDSAYPLIIAECCEAIVRVRGRTPFLAPQRDSACIVVVSYWGRWPCLFPQHGPGRKHHRPIVLAEWQQAIVEAHPGPLIRGLIHSDGWRGLNRVTVKGRAYAYPRYQFSNRSDDIRRIFTDACDRVGAAWRPWGRWHVSVARRDSVALLDEFVGPKR